MDEQSEERDREQNPRWVPYTPPPLEGWDRVRHLARRLSFPLAAILFVAGVAGFFYWGMQGTPAQEARPSINVSSPNETETGGEDSTAGWAQVTVQSSPTGAAVRVNGDSIGTTPLLDHALRRGVYMLSVRADGHFRADTVITLEEGMTPTLRLALRARPGADTSSDESPPDSLPPPDARSAPVASSPDEDDPPQASERPALGTLYVTSTPEGALVTVGETERGRTPVSVSRLPVGEKSITLSLDGYEPWSTTVAVQPDTTRQVQADLQARTGQLRVLARPWGTIYVDGTLHARESDVWYETSMPAGGHRVTVVHPTLGQVARDVQVEAGEETSIVVDLREEGESDSSS